MREQPAFDVILCDLQPGDMSGIDLWRALALACPDAQRHVVFLTGDCEGRAQREDLARADQSVLEKPCPKEQLLEAFRVVVERAA